jgi:hypothetical protein|tara:strand:- start:225 stop:494 length:270 start_codon:yes stop_codon:yes gene_type:complete
MLPQTTQGVTEMSINADSVLTGSGIISRVELVLLASKLARSRKCSAVKALLMLESGEINVEELRETLLLDLQKIKPPEIEADEDQTPES